MILTPSLRGRSPKQSRMQKKWIASPQAARNDGVKFRPCNDEQ